MIKLVMAGADVTMLCSALMRHGITHIQRIEMDLVAWLEQHQHKSLRELKGIMSQQNCPDPSAFERAQYVARPFQLHVAVPNAALRRRSRDGSPRPSRKGEALGDCTKARVPDKFKKFRRIHDLLTAKPSFVSATI